MDWVYMLKLSSVEALLRDQIEEMFRIVYTKGKVLMITKDIMEAAEDNNLHIFVAFFNDEMQFTHHTMPLGVYWDD